MGEVQKNECIFSDGERFELPEHIGEEYRNKIRKGIDSSKYFLLIYTKEVENSARYIVICMLDETLQSEPEMYRLELLLPGILLES